MDDQNRPKKPGRPKVDASQKRAIVIDVRVSELENAELLERARAAGLPLRGLIRSVLFGSGSRPLVHSLPVENVGSGHSLPVENVRHSLPVENVPVDEPQQSEAIGKPLLKTPKPLESKASARSVLQLKRPAPKEVTSNPRTRAPTSARPVHIGSSDQELVTTDLEVTDERVGFSLRSKQVARSVTTSTVPEPSEPDWQSPPWQTPESVKLKVKLSDGTTVDNLWLYANGCRIAQADAERILTTPALKSLRSSLVKCFAASIRKCYINKWCSAYGRRYLAWMDTARSNNGFQRAAETLVLEYARRGMTADTYLEAAIEMKPLSLKFPTVDMLGGGFAQRIAAWLPVEQRERSKAWSSHEDSDGTQYAHIPGDDGGPVMVIRSRADQAKFLKMHKVG